MPNQQFDALVRQLDAACVNRDLPAARRCWIRIESALRQAGQTFADDDDVGRINGLLGLYAREMHGWEIDHAR